MFNPEEEYKDYGLFDQNYSHDPFREEFFIFDHFGDDTHVPPEQNEDSGHFILDVKKEKPEQKSEPKKMEPKKEVKQEKPELEEGVKGILKRASREIAAFVIILAVVFVAFNWSAFYQIGLNYWYKLTGTEQESVLNNLVEEDTKTENGKLLASSDPVIQKRQIPDLELEIMPLDTRLIIPRIDKNIPVVRVSSDKLLKRDWKGLEADMQKALQDGVVHYPGTSMPGETGNTVITGHSSYFPWDPGRFKDVFALLHEVVVGDKIVVYHNQQKYTYKVTEIKVVKPSDLDVLKQTPEERLTLITCTPVGTNLRRLIVIAEREMDNDNIAQNKVSRD